MDIKALESTPFNTDNWNNWEKTAAGIDLEILEGVFPEAQYIVGPRLGVHQHPSGTLLHKTVSGFQVGSTYRFTVAARRHEQATGSTSIQLGIDGVLTEAPTPINDSTFEHVHRYFVAKQAKHVLSIGTPSSVGARTNAFYLDNTEVVLSNTIIETFNLLPTSAAISAGGTINTPYMRIELPSGQPGHVQMHAVGFVEGMCDGNSICLCHNNSNGGRAQTVRFVLKQNCQSLKFALTSMPANSRARVYDQNYQLINDRVVPQGHHWLTFNGLSGRPIRYLEVTSTHRCDLDNVTIINS